VVSETAFKNRGEPTAQGGRAGDI